MESIRDRKEDGDKTGISVGGKLTGMWMKKGTGIWYWSEIELVRTIWDEAGFFNNDETKKDISMTWC